MINKYITDKTGCDCRDLLTEQRGLTYTIKDSDGVKSTTRFESCADLAATAPELCNSYRDSLCCRSCVGGKIGKNITQFPENSVIP